MFAEFEMRSFHVTLLIMLIGYLCVQSFGASLFDEYDLQGKYTGNIHIL